MTTDRACSLYAGASVGLGFDNLCKAEPCSCRPVYAFRGAIYTYQFIIMLTFFLGGLSMQVVGINIKNAWLYID